MCLSFLADYYMMNDEQPLEKFDEEDEMLRRYNVHMKMQETFKNLSCEGNWRQFLRDFNDVDELKVHRQ